jgi:hypothetical protein
MKDQKLAIAIRIFNRPKTHSFRTSTIRKNTVVGGIENTAQIYVMMNIFDRILVPMPRWCPPKKYYIDSSLAIVEYH